MKYFKAIAAAAFALCSLQMFGLSAEDVITKLPAGAESVYYYRHVSAILDDPDDGFGTYSDHGYLSEIANTDTEIFICDPFTSIPRDTYLQGYREGNDIIFPMPQAILFENGNLYTARMMTPNDWNGIKEEPEEQALILTLDANNNLVQKPGNGYLGLFLNDLWVGLAEYNYEFSVFKDKVNNRPLNAKFEEWNLIANGSVTKVEVTIQGDKMWIENLYEFIDGAAICGTIDGGKVSFDPAQYLGIDLTYNYFMYFMPAKIVSGGAQNNYEFLDGPLVFDFDAEAKEMRASDSFLINAGKEEVAFVDNFDAPIIRENASVGAIGAPMDPVIVKFLQYGFNPSANFGAVYFDLPKMDVNGNVLDPDNMAYNFYIDGELFTFRQGEVQLIVQDYVNVPYQLNNYFEIQGGDDERHAIFFNRPVKKVGIRSIYAEDYDPSTWHYSNIVEYVAVEDGIGAIAGGAEIVSTRYFDLSGREIAEPAGPSVRIDTYSDGSSKVTKTF